ncbi:MAG: SdrD B-like domain-containing protein [Chitinophagales bacterium]
MIRTYTKGLFAFILMLFLFYCNSPDTFAQCTGSETEITVTVSPTGAFSGEIGWELLETATGTSIEGPTCGDFDCGTGAGCPNCNTPVTQTICVSSSTQYTFNAYDSFGDGWSGSTVTIEISSGADDGCVFADLAPTFGFDQPIPGGTVCNAASSCNFGSGNNNPQIEDQFIFTINLLEGCTNPAATNYISCAVVDDGTCLLPALNDECVDAIAIPVEVGTCTTGNTSGNIGSTISTGFPVPGCAGYTAGGEDADVWYTVTVPASGSLGLTMSAFPGGPTDMAMAAYSGSCGALTLLDCDDDDGVGAFPALGLSGLTPGSTVYLLVWEFGGNAEGLYNMIVFDPPVGSNCDNPVVVSSLPFTEDNGDFPGAGTTECMGDNYGPTLCGNFSSSSEKVYEFTPTTDMDIQIDITEQGGGFDGFDVHVFQGCPDFGTCEATFTTFSGNGTIPSVDLTANVTYYIVVSGDGFPDILNYDIEITENIPLTCPPGEVGVAVNIVLSGFPNEVGWEIVGAGLGANCGSASTGLFEACLPEDTYTFNAFDSFGDGWNGGTYTIEVATGPDAGCILGFGSPTNGSTSSGGDTPSDITCAGVFSGGPDLEDTFTFDLTNISCITGFDCSTATVIDPTALPYIEVTGGGAGTTCGYGDDYGINENPCNAPGIGTNNPTEGEDKIYTITPVEDIVVNVTVNPETDFADPGLFIYDDCPDVSTTNCVALNFFNGTTSADLVIEEVVLLAGQTYYIQVDHYSFSTSTFNNCYNYELTIEAIPCGSDSGTPIAPSQQVCMVPDQNQLPIIVPDPAVPFVMSDPVAVNPPADAILVGADGLAYNYIVTDLSSGNDFVGVSDDGSYALPNVVGTNYCFTGVIYDPVSVQTILCDPANANFWASKGIGCGATFSQFLTAIDPTSGVSPYNIPSINDAIGSLCNLVPGECDLCYETAAADKTYCVGVYNCESINCGTVLPTYTLSGTEPICEDDDLALDANYVLIDKEVEGINFILTWFEDGNQIAQTGPGEDGVYGTGDEDLVELYTHPADHTDDLCTTNISSNEYEVQLSCIGKAFDNSTYDNIVTAYFSAPTGATEFIFNFASVPLQAIAQNVAINVEGQAINFASASNAQISIFAPDGSDADNAPDFVTTINATGGTGALWDISEVLTDLSNVEVVAGVWTVQVLDNNFANNGGFPIPEGIVTSLTMSIDWITNEPPVIATDAVTGDTTVDIYDSAQDGVDFLLPEGCAGAITQLCPNVTIEYSLDGSNFTEDAPEDLSIGDVDQLIFYRVSVDGVPDACATEGSYLQTCPCMADACNIIAGDYTIVACVDDPIVLDIFSGNFEEITDFSGDILATGLEHIRCGGGTTGIYPYEAFNFQVAQTGNYTFFTAWGSSFDGYLNLYESPFTPNAVGSGSTTASCTNRIAFNDDFNGTAQSQITNVTLTAGVDYTLVYTTFSGFFGGTDGTYETTITGPGGILSVNTECADPSIYGLSYLITKTETDVIVGLGNDLTGFDEGIYTVCGFSYVLGDTDPALLIGESYTDLVIDASTNGGICADVETAPTCVTVAITKDCNLGNCPNFIAALAAEEELCNGEPGLFEVLLTNTEKWLVSNTNDNNWGFNSDGFSSGTSTFTIFTLPTNIAAYFTGTNGSGNADNAALTSPQINLSNYTDVTLSFDINFQQSGSAAFPDDQLEIQFWNAGTSTWDTQQVLLDDTPPSCFFPFSCSTTLNFNIIDPAYLTDGFQLQFVYSDNGDTFSQGVGVDNIEITDNNATVPEEAQIFFDNFEAGNVTYAVTWVDPEGIVYEGIEAEIPLALTGNLGNTCLSEFKEVSYAVTCLDNGEIVEEGVVVVEVFPILTEGIHFDLPEQQGCELDIVTNCGAQGNIEVLYSSTGLPGSYDIEVPTSLTPGAAQTIFYQVKTDKAPGKCAAEGVYTASCPFECPSIISSNIALEACGNTPTLFEVEADVPFAEASVNSYLGTTVGRPLWERPIGTGPNVVTEDVRFDIFSFKVPTNGTYTFNANFNNFNGYLHLYDGSFDPTSPFTGLIAGADGSGTSASIGGTLSASKTYYLVISGNTASDIGTFTITLDGPLNSVIHRVPTIEVVWSYNAQQYASGFPTPIRLQVQDAACGKETQPVYYSVQCTALGAGIYFDIARVDVFTKLEPFVDFAIPDTYQDQNKGCSAALINTQCPSELVDFKYSTSPLGPFTSTPPALTPGTGIVVYYTANLIDGPAGCGISGDSYIVACPNCPTFDDITASSTLMCTGTNVNFDADITDGLLQIQGTVSTITGSTVGGPLVNLGATIGSAPYDVFIFTVPVSGAYIINQVQNYNGFLLLYQNGFDANNINNNLVAQNDDGAQGVGTSQLAASLSAGTTYYLVTTGNADPFGFNNGEPFEGSFTTTFTPGVSPFLQVYDLQWLYGFQGSNSESTTFEIINDQACGIGKQNVSLEVVCRGSNEVLADTAIALTVYPVLSPLANFFVPDPSGIAPGIPNTETCSVDLIFDLCKDTDTELDILYSLDDNTYVELVEDDFSTPENETYSIDSLFNDQTPVDNPGTNFDLGPKDLAILNTGEAALIFFQIDRPGAPAACKTAAGSFRQVCVDFDGSEGDPGAITCPEYNFATVQGVNTPDIGEACANTFATFAIDIDFQIIPALGIPNYSTQWFGPNGEQPNPLDRLSLSKTFPVRSNAFCDIVQDSATVILDCVSSFPGEAAVTFPQTINLKVDIHPLPPADPADFLSFTTDGCKGIIIENVDNGCDLVNYIALQEPTFPLQVNDEGTAIYELTWDGGPCCAPGVQLNRISDGSFELTPPGIPLPNWNTQYTSSQVTTLPSSFHTFLPHCDNLTCNGGGSPLNPAVNVNAFSSGGLAGKDPDLWGYLWFGGLANVDFEEIAAQGLRVPVNADVLQFRFSNNSCASNGPNFDFIELLVDGQRTWVRTTDPNAPAADQAPCGGGYSLITIDIKPWADGLQHVFTFHGHFYGNGGITNFGLDDVVMFTDCDYSNEEALVEVDYSCLCGQPLDPPYGHNEVGCGSVTYMLPTTIPVDNDELAVFTWTDFATGEVVPSGVEFTMDHPGGCAGIQARTFVVEVTCSEDADFSAFGGSYIVTVYPPLEEGDFELPAPNSCSPEISITDGCGDNTPFEVFYSTDNVSYSTTVPADLEQGTSDDFWYIISARGDGQAPSGTDCVAEGKYTITCTQCPLPTLVNGIGGDRCGDNLNISASINIEGTFIAPTSVEWFLNGQSTGSTGVSFSGKLPEADGCSVNTYELTANVVCSLDDAPITISAGSVTIYGVPTLGEDFNQPKFCSSALDDVCEGVNVSYSVNGLPVEGEPMDVTNGAIIAYSVSIDGAPEGCGTTGFYFYNCPECADASLATGIDGEFCASDVDVLAAVSISGGVNTTTSCEWYINGESTGFVGFVYQATLASSDVVEPTSYNLTSVCSCTVQDGNDIVSYSNPVTVNAGTVVVFPAPQLSAVSAASQSICSGESTTLSVSVVNADPSDIVWTNAAGEAVGTGTTISTGFIENAANCDGQLETYTASVVGGTVPSCGDAVSATFEVNVLPDAGTNIAVVQDGCTVSILGVCEGFTIVHRADGGPLQVGNTFTASAPAPGEISQVDVEFVVTSTNGCGNLSIPTAFECFGQELGSISGIAFRDLNQDGIWQSTEEGPGLAVEVEPGIPNLLVQLFKVTDAGQEINVDTKFTNAQGVYTFSGLDVGTYYVLFDIPQGFIASPADQFADENFDSDIDAGGRTDNYVINEGDDLAGVNAGLYFEGCAGDAGVMPSQTITLCGSEQSATVATSGSTVPDGYAQVFVLHDGSGATLGNVVAINQTEGTFSTNDVAGFGTFYISSVVGPDNDADGFPDLDDPCTQVASGTPFVVVDGLILGDLVENKTKEDYSLLINVNGGSTGSYSIHVVVEDIDGNVIFEEDYSYNEGDNPIKIEGLPINTTYTVTASDGSDCDATASQLVEITVAVELLDFSGEVQETGNLLNWITATEINNDFFTLYHSMDKVNFKAISVVDGAGNSSNANTYNFLHRDAPNGVSYYRLDQTDFDGTTTSSNIISLIRGEGGFGIVEVMPVPTRDIVNLTFTSKEDAEVQGTLHDVSGKVLASFKVDAKGGLNTIKVDVSRYPIGVYLLTINNGNQLLSTKVIKE